jgi:hypothetical protein
METKEVKVMTSLPKEVVTVKFLPRKKGMAANVEDNHVIAGGMLNNSVKRFFAPLKRTGGIANVLTNAEKDYLERVTGMDLSVYGDFWETFSVRLYKEEANNIFDMSDPMGYISVKLLEMCNHDIAPSWDQRDDKPTYQFAITREGEVTDEKKRKLDVKKEAFKAYGRIEHDRSRLLMVLKLLTNKPISPDSKLEWIQGQVEEYLDREPQKFLNIVENPSFETMSLIQRGIDTKVIQKRGNKYTTIDGLELAESGEVPVYANAIKYLENDKNQDIRAHIEARINEAS